MNPSRSRFSLPASACAAAAVCTLLLGCNAFVRVETPVELPNPAGVQPLTVAERFRFTIENLGDVAPGVLYRSAATSASLLEFLAERCRLGHIVNLRKGPSEEERAFVEALGGSYTQLRMSASRPPEPEQILELIRVTHRARADGRSILLHCRGGADRTGTLVAIWRRLFQGADDIEALKDETFAFRHFRWSHPNVHETIERFRPELFMPFVRDAALLDDPESVARLQAAYYGRQPLLSGRTGTTTGPLRAGVARAALLEGLGETPQLATYGPNPGRAHGVREPVFARALVLDNGGFRLGIVSCDLMIMDEHLRREVSRRAALRGVELDDLLLCATHTHTSIGGYVDHRLAEFYIMGAFDASMREHVIERVVAALVEAASSRRPARLGVGRARVAGFSRNRRLGDTVDPELGLIRIVERDSEQSIAVVANFAGHPILEPADGLVSSDYPGLLCRRLDERFGFGLFLQGALGDLNACGRDGASGWITEGLAEDVSLGLFEALEGVVESIPLEESLELGSLTWDMELPPANVNLIPDILFPLEWWAARAMQWPRRAPIQVCRIGDAALVACSTELGSRLGRQIKRRSPAAFPFTVSHANGYAGYAVTQLLHPRSKLDPTSVMANNGPRYGTQLVEVACDLMEVLWGERLDPEGPLLSPASAQWAREAVESDDETVVVDARERMRAIEEEDLVVRGDTTVPQSRRHRGLVGDSLRERVRVDLSVLYVEDARGGDGVEGRVREETAELRFRVPLDVAVSGEVGARHADWDPGTGTDDDAGMKDVVLALERSFTVASDHAAGTALRLTPRLGVAAPTGDPERDAPFAFSAATGVWRPQLGGDAEVNWETARVLALEARYTTSTESDGGRRPGDTLDLALGYRERFGAASLTLDWTFGLVWPDSRRGGRTLADVDERSWRMGLRPGLAVHLGERVELWAQALTPLARHGRGTGEGTGVAGGVSVSF